MILLHKINSENQPHGELKSAILIYSLSIFIIICLFVFVGIGYFIKVPDNKFISEYEIQLIDQNKVIIHSVSSDKYITTTPDSIVYYLELDNL